MEVKPQSLNGLSSLSEEQLRAMTTRLLGEPRHSQALNAKLTHESSLLKRMKFAAKSEHYNAQQRSLLDDEIEADLAAISEENAQLQSPPSAPAVKAQPKRQLLPAELPRKIIHHDPEFTTCACGCRLKRIGEDIGEKLDYEHGVFTVERHIRSKWACTQCETITQVPVDAHVIDKGIPTAGLLAHVLVAKYADHLPLNRREGIFGRAGLAILRSTLAQWVDICSVRLQLLVDALKEEMLRSAVLHADETPVQMLQPGKGSTHRAYLWAYVNTTFDGMKAVVYDFCESRAGEHARKFLGNWTGSLVCDGFSGYKQSFTQGGITEAGCLAHARRKFFDLHAANKSQLAEFALTQIGKVCEIERQTKELSIEDRLAMRHKHSQPILKAQHERMLLQRQQLPDSSATAKALDYSIRRWTALTRFTSDGRLPVDNNWIESQIRSIAVGRNHWLFVGSLRAGQRAAAVMSLVQSAKLNGHDPFTYLKDVLTRLLMQPSVCQRC